MNDPEKKDEKIIVENLSADELQRRLQNSSEANSKFKEENKLLKEQLKNFQEKESLAKIEQEKKLQSEKEELEFNKKVNELLEKKLKENNHFFINNQQNPNIEKNEIPKKLTEKEKIILEMKRRL